MAPSKPPLPVDADQEPDERPADEDADEAEVGEPESEPEGENAVILERAIAIEGLLEPPAKRQRGEPSALPADGTGGGMEGEASQAGGAGEGELEAAGGATQAAGAEGRCARASSSGSGGRSSSSSQGLSQGPSVPCLGCGAPAWGKDCLPCNQEWV